MKVLTFTGWAQHPDALDGFANQCGGVTIHHADFQANSDPDLFLEQWEPEQSAYDIVIGWSLGARVAMEMIARGRITASHLVLLAPPYQFVASQDVPDAQSQADFEAFLTLYQRNPGACLKHFGALMRKGNSETMLDLGDALHSEAAEGALLQWLEWLGKARGCPTLPDGMRVSLIHGDEDAVVPATQLQYFMTAIPGAQLALLPHCGHTPHWHRKATVII